METYINSILQIIQDEEIDDIIDNEEIDDILNIHETLDDLKKLQLYA